MASTRFGDGNILIERLNISAYTVLTAYPTQDKSEYSFPEDVLSRRLGMVTVATLPVRHDLSPAGTAGEGVPTIK